MFKKLKNKNRLLAVMIANTFFCILFTVGCGQEKDKISLMETEVSTENVKSDVSSKRRDVTETEADIFVYISGAVKTPGVYTVKEGSRLFQIVELAGGLTKSAKNDYLNQAETVVDGQNIKVLTKKEYAKMKEKEKSDVFDGNIDNNKTSDGKININSADVATLMQLPGIGESKAKTIVAYREENGSFSMIEDIKNVSGIGDSIFANISENITVN